MAVASWALVALWAGLVASLPSPRSLKSDLSILIENDLEGPDSSLATSGVILLGPRSYADAVSGCQALGEQLWSPELQTASIRANLDYLKYQGRIDDSTRFWIAASSGNQTRALSPSGHASSAPNHEHLPVLCTQSAPFSNETTQDTGDRWQVSVHSNNEDYIGFRDRLSFRFLGIRYAPQPKRFTYSVPYNGSGKTVSALAYGSQCVQTGGGAEDCLFLNIWTPYLPRPGCKRAAGKQHLKPVMFWIHGGAFTGGTGNDPTADGGNLASRGDVVVVDINYRLTTLGFLALDDGVTNGNFGLADQINALDWVRAHIRDFGGDPDRITIFGQSAGAGSVRAMMASPRAAGKFWAAVPLSNLGGINYGTTYSKYYTIGQEVEVAARPILAATNCTDAPSQVDCLRAVPAATLASLPTVARFLVVDGTYLTTDELPLGPEDDDSHNDNGGGGGGYGSPPRRRFSSSSPPRLLMGTMRDDGAPFISFPTTANESAYLASAGFNVPPPDLFPIPQGPNATLDLYNMSSRLATDGIFRCVDEATVKRGLETGRLGEAVYYYEFDRSYQTTGWPGTDVCEPPHSAAHPLGDPSRPYFRCHSGELYYVFGNLARQGLAPRDEADRPFERRVLDAVAAFARTGDPNPDEGFLVARGFEDTLRELREQGRWEPSRRGKLTMRVLDWPSYQAPFRELEQCKALGLGLDYYG